MKPVIFSSINRIEIGSVFKPTSFFLIVLIFSALLSSCSDEQPFSYQPEFSKTKASSNAREYIFGVHPLHNPQRLHEVFGPLMTYLSDNISGANFKLEASRNYAAYDEKLYAKKFHFALPNPFQTINSVAKGYKIFGKMSDDENFRGIILVRKDSGIKQVSELRGQAVSYPAPTALAATMMPQYYLQTHGLDVMTELDNRYVGSQESAIMNVYLGNTIAGSTWPPPWKALSRERPELARELIVMWETESLPNNGLVVLPSVPEAVLKEVSRLLFNLHQTEQGKAILSVMLLSRFEEADNTTYQPVWDFIRNFSDKVRPVQ